MLRSQKSSGALVESNKSTFLLRLRKRVFSEDLLNWQTCRGHSVCPPDTLTIWRRLWLDLQLRQRSSNLSDSLFSLLFCFCFPSSPQPLFLHGWLFTGASALPPPTVTTTSARWQGPLLLITGQVPHGRHFPTSCGRHCPSEHTSRLAFWSYQFSASCSTTNEPLRGGTAQAPPARLNSSLANGPRRRPRPRPLADPKGSVEVEVRNQPAAR